MRPKGPILHKVNTSLKTVYWENNLHNVFFLLLTCEKVMKCWGNQQLLTHTHSHVNMAWPQKVVGQCYLKQSCLLKHLTDEKLVQNELSYGAKWLKCWENSRVVIVNIVCSLRNSLWHSVLSIVIKGACWSSLCIVVMALVQQSLNPCVFWI